MKNPLAFPVSTDYGFQIESSAGMTLRDYFAAKAMQGLMANRASDIEDEDKMAAYCYLVADSMLRVRQE